MAQLFKRKGRRLLGIDLQDLIKGFFSGNATVSIVVLLLICLFLVFEAVQFFPQHHAHLQLVRKSGQEYVDYVIKEADEYAKIVSFTNQAYFQELDAAYRQQLGIVECFESFLELLEDDGEALIAALDDAEDDPEALKLAQAEWRGYVAEAVEAADRAEIDSFGRLDDATWKALKNAMPSWDPLGDDSPAYVLAAEREMKAGMAQFELARDEIAAAGTRLKELRANLVGIAGKTKEEAEADASAAERKQALLAGAELIEDQPQKKAQIAQAEAIVIREAFPFAARVEAITASNDEHVAAVSDLKKKLEAAMDKLPETYSSDAVTGLIGQLKAFHPRFVEKLDESVETASSWKWDEKVSYLSAATTFFFGPDWVTNSSWHDSYGLLPLFIGSMLISMVALVVAVPFSIGAAIYVNRLASRWEQNVIKPLIEMIQAIPSVVLGFFGIMVLGEALRDLSQIEALAWIPGFPMQERLNILNAGLLLAFMAVPTIFTLCEDALNNVPRSYGEASLALGATQLQTITRVIIPPAISGILAAVLLGFGRIIGETMVVLLVAGNKISLPDWGAGLGVFAQPTHTMTGIIAQEMGEVTEGTLHFRALFLVGLVLFSISLAINCVAQRIIKRLGHA